MAGFSTPGPVCGSRDGTLDDGTSCLFRTPEPGPLMCREGDAPSWLPPPRHWHLQSVPGGFPAALLAFGPEGVALLKAIETLRLKPYDDQTGQDISAWVAGATIGYGHLIAKGEWSRYSAGITQEGADALFAADLAPFEELVGRVITANLQQYEFDALVILAFNIGPGGFEGSSVARLVNDPKAKTSYASLEAAWMAWNKSQGKVMKGLDNRRKAEWKIYSTGIYERW